MFLFKLVIAYMCFTYAVCGENIIKNCPRFCKCDSYLQLNRAECSSRRLISAEVDLPNLVQILDLSYNTITTVDKNCFASFTHLRYLNLSHNALYTLDWEAFSKLRLLTEINLSHNRLEFLDERLFVRNKYLLKINLEGNKLQFLQHKALLSNQFVMELNLKNSHLYSLQPEVFVGLPNLKHLDLSNNLLNNFNLEDFKYLRKLEYLNINENSIKCDEKIQDKLRNLKAKGIKVSLDKCLRGDTEKFPQFEKMIMIAPQTEIEEDDKENFKTIQPWRLDIDFEEDAESYEDGYSQEINFSPRKNQFSPETILCNTKNAVLCQEYRSCLQNLNKAWQEQHKYKEPCPLYDVKFAFVMGIAIGVSAIVFILACALCTKKCLEAKKSTPPAHSIEDLYTQPLARPTNQLPPQVRRPPRRRTAPPQRSMIRYEGPVAENFLSRLFGRPARHQYYRTINQNTATLIRRLSRSNLFNNRFLDRQTSAEPNSGNGEYHAPSAPRAETPPPSYGDILISNCSDAK